MRYGTVATNRIDQDNERFSDEALQSIYRQIHSVPVTVGFTSLEIGHVDMATLTSDGRIEISIDAELPDGLYAVPGFSFKPEDVTVEDGVKVYHRVTLTGIGLTHDPADNHLDPLTK